MIFQKTAQRFFHTTKVILASEKSVLATLRKKTGYTFANCKKALEMHNNDIVQAEDWLRKQAQAMGWSKATKLEGRQTSQGLVGVAVENNNGVLVEVNCETDFVAKNNEFELMVEEAVKSCLDFVKASQKSSNIVTKVFLSSEQLKNLKGQDGKSLADKMALLIGTVGENASLKRAVGLKVNDNLFLAGYAHPTGRQRNNISFGRLGGLVALKAHGNSADVEDVGKKLCQHIVGMNPQRIGKMDEEPAKDKEEETSLLFQEFVLDEGVLVKEVLHEHQLEVVDFKRFECGESIQAIGDQPLEYVETCQ